MLSIHVISTVLREKLLKNSQCPTGISYDEYDELRIRYKFEGKLTKKGFQEFVAKVRNLKQVK